MFDVKFVVLYTDVVIWLLALLIVAYAVGVLRSRELSRKWARVWRSPTAGASAAVLAVFFALALADSVHFREALPPAEDAAPGQPAQEQAWSGETLSLMDVLVKAHIAGRERSYSEPFALREFDKSADLNSPTRERIFARLTGASPDLAEDQKGAFLLQRLGLGLLTAAGVSALFWLACTGILCAVRKCSFAEAGRRIASPANRARSALIVWQIAIAAGVLLAFLWPHFHIFGTDTTGNDVLYSAVKSVRTAVVIGSLATLTTLPFAVTLGIAAGYFRGWVDDVIQYIYTTITSIPSVLLIAASVLMIQVFIDKNPQAFATGLERADVRLFLLAAIIGMTSWAGLARLLRAETMKVSSMDFVTAARAFGVSDARIMARHVLPNIVHIVLIVTVLDFSGIVLYEAVLSYVGVGVDPTMQSFGSMINAAAVEMSRIPVVWWNLTACFVFMVSLVLAANLFASRVRDAFDPRSAGAGDA